MQRRSPYIAAHACLVHVVATKRTGTSSIGCVDAESKAPVDSNAGEPSRCTSDKEYFGAEDDTFVESSIGEPSCNAQLCRSSLVPQE